jgi:hypothetical protein
MMYEVVESRSPAKVLELRLNATPLMGPHLLEVSNSIARVRPKENDPSVDHVKADEEAGLVYNVYKHVGPFLLELPLAEVKSLLSLSEAKQGHLMAKVHCCCQFQITSRLEIQVLAVSTWGCASTD